MRVNLHLHSRYSDGTLWPEEIIKRAKKLALDQVALTDHDCMEGVEAFMDSARKRGIQAIPGVEIDCEAPEISYNSEILGYFPGSHWPRTRTFCLKRMAHREKRIKKLISLASRYFRTHLTFRELKRHKLGIPPAGVRDPRVSYSKPDLFEYVKSRDLLPLKYSYGKFKKLPFLTGARDPKPSVKAVIDTILQDGGIPVLPHPGLIFNRDIKQMASRGKETFKWFKDKGILGLECNHYAEQNRDNTRELNQLVRKFALELGLQVTWGSDCHGPGHPSDTMEKFRGSQGFPFR